MKSLLFVALFVTLALAGCSKPPAGTLTSEGPAINVEGTAVNDFRAAVNPYNQTLPLGGTACAAPPPAPQCVPASSSVRVRFAALPSATNYHVWLTGGSPALDIGALTENGTGYDMMYSAAGDLSGKYQYVEVHLGDFVIAQAAAKVGPNKFVALDNTLATQLTGSFKGPVLTYSVSGLPPNATFVGRLYAQQGETLAVQEEFPISGDGESSFTAKVDISAYKEFHIHVAGSAINLVKSTITVAA